MAEIFYGGLIMKKFLFTVLVFLNVFMIAGCSDSNDDNGGGGNGVAFPADLLGTYNVTFFGTQVTNVRPDSTFAKLYYVTNNCEEATKLFPSEINKETGEVFPSVINGCTQETQSTISDGTVVISRTNDGALAITSEIKMEGGAVEASKADKYQYTEYYPTSDFLNYEGKGVKGWNYDYENYKVSDSPTEFPKSPYKITKQDDGSLRIDMTLVDKEVPLIGVTIDAVTTVIMTKVSNDTTKPEMDINPFPSSPAE